MEGSWKDYKLIVKKAAPGTYFVLFGSLIIAATIYKGFSVDEPAGIATGINKHMHIPIDSFRKSGDTIKIK